MRLLLLAALLAAGHAAEWRDRSGVLLRVDSPPRASLETVSPWAVLATLAAEDRRFYEHPGVDWRAVSRSLWRNASGAPVSGASTLTQQLARALRPRPRTLAGKAAEALQALALERRLGKREILEAYLDEVEYGPRLKGLEAASRGLFGVPARDLTLAQAALLAGLPQAPTRYDPRKGLTRARARQRRVLARLAAWGWIDEPTRARALAERLELAPAAPPFGVPQLIEAARALSPSESVTLAVDAELQTELQALMRAHLARLRQNEVGNAALVALDNATGEVLAYAGSADYDDQARAGRVDGAAALRQPGSALKPFLYGLALSRGLRLSDLLEDEPVMFPGGFAPRNYDETFHGKVPARQALACSYNVPAARLAERVGADALLGALHAFGFASLDLPASYYGLGLSLGNGEVTLLELAAAYSALARGGVWLAPRLTLAGAGERRPAARRALDRESAYLVTDALSDNAARAPAFGFNSPLHLPFPFAAKTGTTKDYRDNWAAGYTPEWTIAVWVGNFDGAPMRRVSGITGAAPLLRDAALAVARRRPPSAFSVPVGIRRVRVCPVSGRVAGAFCPAAVEEAFEVRRPPAEGCPEHEHPELRASKTSGAIEFPRAGDVFKLDPGSPREAQRLLLKAASSGGERGWRWRVDGRELDEQESQAWWQLQPGPHSVTVERRLDGRLHRAAPVPFLVLP